MARESRGRVRENRPGLLRASLNPWLVRVEDHPERLAFVLHRVTGVIIILYLLAHVVVTNTPARAGWESWDQLMEQFGTNIWNQIGEFIVAGSVLFHGMNGIRLLLAEFFGVCIGKPEKPKPPYIPPTYKACQRQLLYLIFALWPVLWVFAGLLIFGVF
jgi:succinate dehydrogenase / fumarate reductase cytochrome b subunit